MMAAVDEGSFVATIGTLNIDGTVNRVGTAADKNRAIASAVFDGFQGQYPSMLVLPETGYVGTIDALINVAADQGRDYQSIYASFRGYPDRMTILYDVNEFALSSHRLRGGRFDYDVYNRAGILGAQFTHIEAEVDVLVAAVHLPRGRSSNGTITKSSARKALSDYIDEKHDRADFVLPIGDFNGTAKLLRTDAYVGSVLSECECAVTHRGAHISDALIARRPGRPRKNAAPTRVTTLNAGDILIDHVFKSDGQADFYEDSFRAERDPAGMAIAPVEIYETEFTHPAILSRLTITRYGNA